MNSAKLVLSVACAIIRLIFSVGWKASQKMYSSAS